LGDCANGFNNARPTLNEERYEDTSWELCYGGEEGEHEVRPYSKEGYPTGLTCLGSAEGDEEDTGGDGEDAEVLQAGDMRFKDEGK
jgi:hypothetical protein